MNTITYYLKYLTLLFLYAMYARKDNNLKIYFEYLKRYIPFFKFKC